MVIAKSNSVFLDPSIKSNFKSTYNAQNFIETRRLTKKHFFMHGLVIQLPGCILIFSWSQAKRALLKGTVVNPVLREEADQMFGHANKKGGILHARSATPF